VARTVSLIAKALLAGEAEALEPITWVALVIVTEGMEVLLLGRAHLTVELVEEATHLTKVALSMEMAVTVG
jgi:hypothetical protein